MNLDLYIGAKYEGETGCEVRNWEVWLGGYKVAAGKFGDPSGAPHLYAWLVGDADRADRLGLVGAIAAHWDAPMPADGLDIREEHDLPEGWVACNTPEGEDLFHVVTDSVTHTAVVTDRDGVVWFRGDADVAFCSREIPSAVAQRVLDDLGPVWFVVVEPDTSTPEDRRRGTVIKACERSHDALGLLEPGRIVVMTMLSVEPGDRLVYHPLQRYWAS